MLCCHGMAVVAPVPVPVLIAPVERLHVVDLASGEAAVRLPQYTTNSECASVLALLSVRACELLCVFLCVVLCACVRAHACVRAVHARACACAFLCGCCMLGCGGATPTCSCCVSADRTRTDTTCSSALTPATQYATLHNAASAPQ